MGQLLRPGVLLVFGLAAALFTARAAPAQATHSDNIEAGVPYRLALPVLASDGLFPDVSVSNDFAYQGGAVRVDVANATGGQVTVFGRSYPLMAQGTNLEGFVGFGTEDPVGAATLVIDVTDTLGSSLRYTRPLTIRKTQWTVDYIQVPPDSGGGVLQDPTVGIREQQRLDSIYANVTPRKWRGKWISPIPGKPVPGPEDVSGYFGEQRSFNGGPVSGHHGGTDLGLAAGTPVLAANDGVVVLAEELAVRGNMVIIDHGGGVFTGYGHMEKLNVQAGQAVSQGDIIGWVGTTGLSTGPHLHWEMSVSGVLVDALRWLDDSQGF